MLDIFRTLRESYCGLPPQWGCAVNGTAVAEVLIDQSFSFITLPIEWHHYWWCLMTCCLKSFCLTYNMYYLQYVYTDQKPHVTCNFNCFFFKNEGLQKVTVSHVHCKCGNISETVSDSIVVATDH